MFTKEILVFFVAALYASIRVMNKSFRRSVPHYGVLQRLQAKFGFHVIGRGPTHYFLGEYILNGGQVKPAFQCMYGAEIRYPLSMAN